MRFDNLDTHLSIEDKIIKVKVLLQKENPFFAYILSHLRIHKSKDVPTMGVNAKGDLYYNEDFVKSLSLPELKGVLAHETLHVVFEHMIIRGQREPMIWNIAADLVVNKVLKENNFKLIEGALVPYYDSFELPTEPPIKIEDISKKTSFQIYEEIEKHKNKSNNGNGNGNGNGKSKKRNKGAGSNGNGDSSGSGNGFERMDKQRFDKHILSSETEVNEQEKDKWKQVAIDAWYAAQSKGNVPGGMERFIKGLLKPKVNWKQQLHRFIKRMDISGWNWNLPSKRSQAIGVYMPRIKRERVDLIVTIDTSGSIDDSTLKQFLSEMISIVKSRRNVRGYVLVGDMNVNEVYPIQNGNIKKLMTMKFKGGGGTSHIPFYEWIKEHKPNTKLVINLTDGYTDFPEGDLIKPTLWVLTIKGAEIPFGKVIYLDKE